MNLKEALDVVLHKEHLGDSIYAVRDRCFEGNEFKDYNDDPANKGVSSWEHPRVARFSQAVAVLEDYYKTLEK